MITDTQLKELKILLKKNISYIENQDLSSLCSFRIGGIAPLVIEPENEAELLLALSHLEKLEIPYRLLGGGTNLLISDHPDDFVTLRLRGKFKDFIELEEGKFYIGGAASTTPTFRKISLSSYTGAEFLSTIPGWVGGAVVQNAGCYGGEIFELIESVTYLKSNSIIEEKKEYIQFGYRTTQFLEKKDSIILGIRINLQRGKEEEIEESLKDKRERRNSSQPQNKKSAGSIFKNPKELDTEGKPLKSWKLIEQAGLRGLNRGDALVSPEHCNFIVNTGKAKAKDVDYLICLIKEKVYEFSNVLLEQEVEYFGTIP